jgi:hypothetical protein
LSGGSSERGRYELKNLSYNKIGNIKNLTRKGWKGLGNNYSNTDILSYTFQPNSNMLSIVSYTGNDKYGFKDDLIGIGNN